MKLAIFIGIDIVSTLIANKLIPVLLQKGHELFLFYPIHRENSKTTIPELRELIFYERELLNKYVTPFLESTQIQAEALCLTYPLIAMRYEISVKEIYDVNDPDFINYLKEQAITGGISVRFRQKFQKEIISFFNRNDEYFLVNLHPGILPFYRGVLPILRAMANNEENYGFTLHYVDAHFDSGPIIDIFQKPLDYSVSVLSNLIDMWPVGANMILYFIESFTSDRPRKGIPQDEMRRAYYSFPTNKDFIEYYKKGIRLVDPQRIIDILVTQFTDCKHSEELLILLKHAIETSDPL